MTIPLFFILLFATYALMAYYLAKKKKDEHRD